MKLSILSVAYPFAPVRPDTPGGAEQILGALDRALVAQGHRSTVVAQSGSAVAGRLVAPPAIAPVDDAARARAHKLWRKAIAREMRGVDLVHLHGIDFHAYLPPAGPPALVTLHLPLSWYSPEALRPARPDTHLHCVSASQQAGEDLPHLLPPIENGVPAPDRPPRLKGRYALMLTRICPEKGVHLALDAAKAAGVPMVVAGEAFPYPDHQRYFAEEVSPRLDAQRRFVGPVGGDEKRRLLEAARCLLVASTVDETSSLAAREALAAGTPVIAFARGALVDTVEHGRTGFLVRDVAEMAAAIRRAATIDPLACRAAAAERYSEKAMIDRYLDTYRRLARVSSPEGEVVWA